LSRRNPNPARSNGIATARNPQISLIAADLVAASALSADETPQYLVRRHAIPPVMVSRGKPAKYLPIFSKISPAEDK
jgi:hypothetical protein